MMKNKAVILTVTAILLVAAAVASVLFLPRSAEKPFADILDFPIEEISELALYTDLTKKQVSVTDPEEIDEILSLFRNATLESPEQNKADNYNLAVLAETESGKTAELFFPSPFHIRIGRMNYEVVNGPTDEQFEQVKEKYSLDSETFAERRKYTAEETVKIILKNGLNGKTAEMTEAEEIHAFLNIFNSRSLKLLYDDMYREPFLLSAVLCTADGKTEWFSFGAGEGIRGLDQTKTNNLYLADQAFTLEEIQEITKKYGIE